mmetsp:Transcript_34664/g.38696  ORF Transcript_34664/g.38696 Transcript_34664/m.38696 type:complete len:97 (+) Transcript_34664:150-440(+)
MVVMVALVAEEVPESWRMSTISIYTTTILAINSTTVMRYNIRRDAVLFASFLPCSPKKVESNFYFMYYQTTNYHRQHNTNYNIVYMIIIISCIQIC